MRPELLTPAGDLSPETVRAMLGLICVSIPLDILQGWTEMELAVAYDWSIREHLHASDSNVRRRQQPSFVCRAALDATRGRGAGERDREHVVQLSDENVQALRQWLERPNGAFLTGTLASFNAVSGGGILVRTEPYRAR